MKDSKIIRHMINILETLLIKYFKNIGYVDERVLKIKNSKKL